MVCAFFGSHDVSESVRPLVAKCLQQLITEKKQRTFMLERTVLLTALCTGN